jgi:16S rRNA processing protein RimM
MKHQLKRIKKNKQILSNKNLLEIGLLLGVHGVKGEVKLKSYTEIPENIFSYKDFYIENSNKPINLKFVRKVKQNLICKIENISTRTDAEKLRGLKLFINRDNLSKLADDEFYQVDLIGFQVYNLNRESFGSVISFNDFGGGLLVEVKNNNKMFYLPMGSNFLKNINYVEKEVVLNLDLSFVKD